MARKLIYRAVAHNSNNIEQITHWANHVLEMDDSAEIHTIYNVAAWWYVWIMVDANGHYKDRDIIE